MALPSDLTSQHAKIDANISLLRGRLASAQRPEQADGAFDQLKLWAEQVGGMLHGYVHDEQRVLLQQATRVLGETLEEVSEIHDQNAELLERFARFQQALDTVDDHLDDASLAQARDSFDEFYACFERHSDAERNFYTLYSTILFPSGAATD